jgi:hypothetical protein
MKERLEEEEKASAPSAVVAKKKKKKKSGDCGVSVSPSWPVETCAAGATETGVGIVGVESKACPSPLQADAEGEASASVVSVAGGTVEADQSLFMSKFHNLSLGGGAAGQSDGGGEAGSGCEEGSTCSLEVWSVKQVADHVRGLTEPFGERAAAYSQSMTKEDINGKALVELNSDDLKVSLLNL